MGARSVIAFRAHVDKDHPWPPPATVVRHPEQSFLDAGFLADPDTREPVNLVNPDGFALIYHEPKGSVRQLFCARMSADQELVWTRALFDDKVLGGRQVGDVLVLVLRDSLIGLDVATGSVRYQHPF